MKRLFKIVRVLVFIFIGYFAHMSLFDYALYTNIIRGKAACKKFGYGSVQCSVAFKPTAVEKILFWAPDLFNLHALVSK